MATEYKLIYFNARGKAEGIRFILAAGDQKYEDFRFEREQWPNLKPSMPFGQAPVLELKDGDETTHIAQSSAIARYLANKLGLAGKSELEKARADMVVDQLNDLFTQYSQAMYYETDEVRKKEKIEKLYAETFPSNFEMLERLIKKQSTEFFASNEITWADLIFAAALDLSLIHISQGIVR